MSCFTGPAFATSGLVLSVDAANSKSYPGSGTVWADETGAGNTLALQNGPTFSSTNGGSIVLDGIDDRVAVTCAASTIRTYNASTHFTIKLPTYAGGQRCILSYRGSGTGNLYIGKSSAGIFCYYNELSTAAYTVGSITDNTVAVCCVTLDATNNLLTTYINGVQAGQVSRTGWVSTYASTFYLGYDAGGTNEYMVGDFYHFAHYNRVLTATEVSNNYNAIRARYGL